MKRIKWTPVLLLFPISIIIFIIDMRSEAWTPFSLFFHYWIYIDDVFITFDRPFFYYLV